MGTTGLSSVSHLMLNNCRVTQSCLEKLLEGLPNLDTLEVNSEILLDFTVALEEAIAQGRHQGKMLLFDILQSIRTVGLNLKLNFQFISCHSFFAS